MTILASNVTHDMGQSLAPISEVLGGGGVPLIRRSHFIGILKVCLLGYMMRRDCERRRLLGTEEDGVVFVRSLLVGGREEGR